MGDDGGQLAGDFLEVDRFRCPVCDVAGVCRLANIGIDEHGITHLGAAQADTAQVGATQVHPLQIRHPQVDAEQVRAFEPGAAQPGLLQLGPGQVGGGDVTAFGGFVYGDVPEAGASAMAFADGGSGPRDASFFSSASWLVHLKVPKFLWSL